VRQDLIISFWMSEKETRHISILKTIKFKTKGTFGAKKRNCLTNNLLTIHKCCLSLTLIETNAPEIVAVGCSAYIRLNELCFFVAKINH